MYFQRLLWYFFLLSKVVFACKRVCLLLLLATTTNPIWLREERSSPTEKNTNQTETLHFLVMFYILLLY